MSRKQKYIRVVKVQGFWQAVFSHCYNGYSALDPVKIKARAIKDAFKFAKKLSPCAVRIFSATGKLQCASIV